jgi:hypothetical protein
MLSPSEAVMNNCGWCNGPKKPNHQFCSRSCAAVFGQSLRTEKHQKFTPEQKARAKQRRDENKRLEEMTEAEYQNYVAKFNLTTRL